MSGTKVEDILMNDPITYHKYGRTIEKIEDVVNRKKFRTWMTECKWYYGPTGVGKSRKVLENYDPDTHYIHNLNDKGWWNGYVGQPIVIFNEFRGQIAFSELLDLVDWHPKTVCVRGRQPVPFLAKTILITSSKSPYEIYTKSMLDGDNIDQLERRVTIIKMEQKWSEGNTEPLTHTSITINDLTVQGSHTHDISSQNVHENVLPACPSGALRAV